MPRKPNPKPSEELPPLDSLLEVMARLESFIKDPIAKHAHDECVHAEELWRKDLTEVFREQIAEAQSPTMDLKGLASGVKKSGGILKEILVEEGHQDEVARVQKEYPEFTQATQAFIDLARNLDVDTALPFAKKTEGKLTQYLRAKKRVTEGGHAIFGEHEAHVATKIWITHDNAYDVLGICLRKNGISYDAVWANMPTTKTSLRPQLLKVQAGTSSSKPRKNKKAGGDKAAGKSAGKNVVKPPARATPQSPVPPGQVSAPTAGQVNAPTPPAAVPQAPGAGNAGAVMAKSS